MSYRGLKVLKRLLKRNKTTTKGKIDVVAPFFNKEISLFLFINLYIIRL